MTIFGVDILHLAFHLLGFVTGLVVGVMATLALMYDDNDL
jgi:hypothetical protein